MNRLTSLALIAGLALAFAGCASTGKKSTTAAPAATAAAPAAKATPAPAATPAPKAAADSSKVTCKHGKDERVIEVEALSPKGCKVHYTKAGKTTEPATSGVGTKHCEDAAAKIKKTLTDAKFECN